MMAGERRFDEPYQLPVQEEQLRIIAATIRLAHASSPSQALDIPFILEVLKAHEVVLAEHGAGSEEDPGWLPELSLEWRGRAEKILSALAERGWVPRSLSLLAHLVSDRAFL